ERGGFRLARLARRLVPRSKWNAVFDVGHGLRMQLDLATYPDVAMAGGVYELDTDRLLRKLVRPGMTFVDAGANIGYFSLRVAQLVGPAGRVHAFEPDPVNRQRLLDNLDRNGLIDRVTVHAVALSEEQATLTFHRPADNTSRNHGESGRFPANDGETVAFDVKAERLDTIVTSADVMKMDIEGSEVHALRGATKLLATSPPKIVLEHNPDAASFAGHRPGDLWRVVQKANPAYTCAFVDRAMKQFGSPGDVDAFARQGNLLLST
ncbi:MAG: FkbM family methyltransferase, partial [Planctomycetota bacterium]